jgi:hypothetical protein
VQVYPLSTLQTEHPVILPLSHYSLPATILSPQNGLHTDDEPRTPEQTNPTSGLQSTEHPVLFPLSHSYSPIQIPSPHIV